MSRVTRVSIGSKAHVRFPDGRIRVIQITDAAQAIRPESCIVSHESPIAQALLGKKSGERTRYAVGTSWVCVEIVAIGQDFN